ncbi:MAG: hypothetical protein ACTSXF_02870 [Promethearchaeota archaeon]
MANVKINDIRETLAVRYALSKESSFIASLNSTNVAIKNKIWIIA